MIDSPITRRIAAAFGLRLATFCESCRYRSKTEHCTNAKIHEGRAWIEDDDDTSDMLVYSYHEGGKFWVGNKFGCVHHKRQSHD